MLKHKLIVCSIFIIVILIMSSCSGGSRTEMYNNDSDDKLADARLEQVIEAIKGKDKESIKAMFSAKALEEADDINGGTDYLIDFFQGEVKSTESDGLIVDELTDNGNNTKEVKSFYIVETNEQKYLFFLLVYTEDTGNPENVGLYALRVIKAEDEETQFTSWQDMAIAGIYKPEK